MILFHNTYNNFQDNLIFRHSNLFLILRKIKKNDMYIQFIILIFSAGFYRLSKYFFLCI